MNKKIQERVMAHWNHLLSIGYNEDRLLGIFAYGSMNYGFYKEGESDVDTKAIILPSFTDFCLTPQMISKVEEFDDEKIEVKDIRLYREQLMKQNINFVEVLFTDYFYVNPKYEALFNKYFIETRELIASYDLNKTVKSISGQAEHTLLQDPTDNKKLYNGFRLKYFLEHYLNENPYLECIQPKSPMKEFLYDLKYGEAELCKNDLDKKQEADHLIDYFKAMKERKFDIPVNEDARKALDRGVEEILRFSFANIIESNCISAEEFENKLTAAERIAYDTIMTSMPSCGEETFSISKLVQEHNISRPTYTNLLNKMREHKIAEIYNLGAKGTFIKIIHPEVKSLIDFL